MVGSSGPIDRPVPPSLPTVDPPRSPAGPKQRGPVALPATKVQRVTWPDLTGRYEHVPEPGRNSAVLLHLQQAGRVLVGWFTGPPPFVHDLSRTVSRVGAANDTWMRPGVLVAVLGTSSDWVHGASCSWVQSTRTPATNPPDPMGLHDLDPVDALGDAANVGYLRQSEPYMGVVGQGVQVMFDVRRRDLRTATHYDHFRRIDDSTRLPNFLVQQLPPQLQAVLLAEQVCPLPSSWVDQARTALAGPGGASSTAGRLLVAWHASKGLERRLKREAVMTHVWSALDTSAVPAHYRGSAYTAARAQMQWQDLTIGDQRKSYLQWYRTVAAELVDELRAGQAASPGRSAKEADDPHLRAFSRAGIGPDGDFLYTISFFATKAGDADALRTRAAAASKVDLERPGKKLLAGPVLSTSTSTGGGLQNPLQVLKLTGGLFKLDIKKERVRTERDADGNLKLVDGEPLLQDRTTVWDTAAGGRAPRLGPGQGRVADAITSTVQSSLNALHDGFVGAFLEFGAGVGVAGGTAKASAGSGLSEISFLSALDLTKDDFAWAQLHTVLLAGPKVQLGDYLSLDVFSSRLVELSLTSASGGHTLTAIETKNMKKKVLELSDLKPSFGPDLKKVVTDYEKKTARWTKPEVEARIFELSTSRAVIAPLFTTGPPSRTPSDPLPRPKKVDDAKYASWVVEGFFARDSADLDTAGPAGSLGAGTPRDLLEAHIASSRALLSSSSADLTVCGMTSPEQPSDKNQVLSERRAAAVRQALDDALGPALRATVTSVTGIGERAALSVGLADPEASGLAREQFVQQYPEQVRQWPEWRRTDLLINEMIVVRVQAP